MGRHRPRRQDSPGPWTSDTAPALPPEVWFMILVDALDPRWHFSARAVCRTWHDMISTASARGRPFDVAATLPRACAVVRASSVVAWHPHTHPADLVAFCLSSAGRTRDGTLSASARPLCRRDVLLALVASDDGALVDYALGDLAQCLAPRAIAPTGHPCKGTRNSDNKKDAIVRSCHEAAIYFNHDDDNSNNNDDKNDQRDMNRAHAQRHHPCRQSDRRQQRRCDRDKVYGGDDIVDRVDDAAADDAFYRRATGVALRVGGIDLLQRVAQCVPEFDPLRHVDPMDVISTDCVAALALIDPPSGAFRREGYAVALRAHAAPAVWYEAGRADAAAIVERLLDDATESDALAAVAHANDRAGNTDLPVRRAHVSSVLRGPCPIVAARVAVVHGNVRVLDVLAARSEVRVVATARGLGDLARRAASACSTRGFAWCQSALARIGIDVDVVAAASDAVMGPWIENAPRVAWNTDAAVRFLGWLSRAEGGATLATTAAATEIVRCAGHPRRFPSYADREGDTAQHARAVAAFFRSLSPDLPLDKTPPALTRE
ncbi:F-box incomplete domain containing protein [Pandoravirus dulcis]|uniref:F-box incomplete domain containing protein n=1 Tax=Pandoravirus dulcis TaxID=1349409 RepID=S4VR22_9VIRU|nr:F-box incomplete domain containing protein [Pandoravirus dulcis]AGO82727.1 F-box incomplete domain containing protein [Pandoravirus dulcis]